MTEMMFPIGLAMHIMILVGGLGIIAVLGMVIMTIHDFMKKRKNG